MTAESLYFRLGYFVQGILLVVYSDRLGKEPGKKTVAPVAPRSFETSRYSSPQYRPRLVGLNEVKTLKPEGKPSCCRDKIFLLVSSTQGAREQ
jgi:hypothetical protein